tara:strand:- start:986 stop:1372 length:387 start_codon:yes stop_codon:yes gene_type:complete
MVSIHNTHEFHNYIYSLPTQSFKVNPNTILAYIQSNYPNIYNTINDLHFIRNKLNNPSFKYTIFLPTSNFDYNNLLNHVFKGVVEVNDNDCIVISEGGTKLEIKDGNVNGLEITTSNINVGNGIIHIL